MHGAAAALLRLGGFDHISDDDFARVTIAQAFAHAPRLDPSGTSWLPFPFWTLGSVLVVVGRSLATARAASLVMASAAVALPYLALRDVGVPRRRALVGMALAYASPWALWLGASTVPESPTASMVCAAAIGLAARPPARPILYGLAALAACLSRYEAWPVAATIAASLSLRAIRDRGRGGDGPTTDGGRASAARWTTPVALALVVGGPLAWLAWNAHAHDGPLHFVRRVTGFKRALGSSGSAWDALALYPRLLVATRPELVVATLTALVVARRATATVRDALGARWTVPLVAAAAQVAFLAYGNVRDGAPAHHDERALLSVFIVLALFVTDALGALHTELEGRARTLGRIGLVSLGAAALAQAAVTAGVPPGTSPTERRASQMDLGARLAREGREHVTLEPCAYEHFATIAAFGSPERVTVAESVPRPVSTDCPRILDGPKSH